MVIPLTDRQGSNRTPRAIDRGGSASVERSRPKGVRNRLRLPSLAGPASPPRGIMAKQKPTLSSDLTELTPGQDGRESLHGSSPLESIAQLSSLRGDSSGYPPSDEAGCDSTAADAESGTTSVPPFQFTPEPSISQLFS